VKSLPVILFGKKWWQKLINWNFLRDEGVIAPEDLALFRYAETAAEAWEKIQDYYKKRGGFGLAEPPRAEDIDVPVAASGPVVEAVSKSARRAKRATVRLKRGDR
jgi:hypothetical protein